MTREAQGCAVCWPISGLTRASSCCYARSSVSAPSGPRTRSGLVSAGRGELSNGIQRMVRDINASNCSRRALWSRDASPRILLDRRQRLGQQRAELLRFGDDGSMLACVFNFSGSEHTATGWVCRMRAAARGAQHRTPTSTTARHRQLRRGGSHRASPGTGVGVGVMVLPPMAALWFEPPNYAQTANGRESASRFGHLGD